MNTTCCSPTQSAAPETRQAETPPPRVAVPRHHLDTLPEKAGWELRVELPGVRKEDIKISQDKDTLTVEGKRSTPVPEGWRAVSARPVAGDYRLQLSLREDLIATDEVTATLQHGVLRLRFPAKQSAQPRLVAVE